MAAAREAKVALFKTEKRRLVMKTTKILKGQKDLLIANHLSTPAQAHELSQFSYIKKQFDVSSRTLVHIVGDLEDEVLEITAKHTEKILKCLNLRDNAQAVVLALERAKMLHEDFYSRQMKDTSNVSEATSSSINSAIRNR